MMPPALTLRPFLELLASEDVARHDRRNLAPQSHNQARRAITQAPRDTGILKDHRKAFQSRINLAKLDVSECCLLQDKQA